MNASLLEIELRLLLLRYSKRELVEALARLDHQTPDGLECQLRALEQKTKSRTSSQKKISLTDIAALECRDRPENAELLNTLASSFEKGVFLPTFHDVKEFLRKTGNEKLLPRTRAAAGPQIVKALSRLAREDLVKISAKANPQESDYSMLSNAIMGLSQQKKPQ